MKLDQVIEELKKLNPKSVLVTGPQRSGTTIAARILAAELSLRYCDENEFGIHDGAKAGDMLDAGGIVMQAPGLMHVAHMAENFKVPVVIMRRALKDIHKSEDRIGWRTAYNGLNLIAEKIKYQKGYGFAIKGDDIARLKYEVWDTIQKKLCTSFDLDYESMRGHPLWKEATERENFEARQFA